MIQGFLLLVWGFELQFRGFNIFWMQLGCEGVRDSFKMTGTGKVNNFGNVRSDKLVMESKMS